MNDQKIRNKTQAKRKKEYQKRNKKNGPSNAEKERKPK